MIETTSNTPSYFGSSTAQNTSSPQQNNINKDPSPTEEFLRLMSMSAEERYFELLLKQKGLTKEELEALAPEEREKILEEIHTQIKQKTENAFREGNVAENQNAGDNPSVNAGIASPNIQKPVDFADLVIAEFREGEAQDHLKKK